MWREMAVAVCLALWVPSGGRAQEVISGAGAGAQAGAATTVVIVRHAEKEDEPRADPPLSVAGEARAVALADALADARVSAILVTPYERTRATARPLAERLGIVPQEVPVGRDIAAHVAAVIDAVQKSEGGTVLIVGHSNTVPLIAAQLSGTQVSPMTEADYDPMFVIVPGSNGGQLIRARISTPANGHR